MAEDGSRKIHDTKKSTGIDQLDDSDRKDLFKKFQKHGGEVIDDTPNTSLLKGFDREKQRKLKAELEANPGGGSKASESFHYYSPKKKSSSLRTGFWERIYVHLKAFFSGSISFSGGYLSKGFLKFLSYDGILHLSDLELLVSDLMRINQEYKDIIKDNLKKKGIYYFELLERMGNIYSEGDVNFILSKFKRNPNSNIRPKQVEEGIKEIFKRLYIIRTYLSSCYIVIQTAVSIMGHVQKKQKTWINKRARKGYEDLNVIFIKLFPKLHSLIMIIKDKNIELDSDEMTQYLKLDEKDRIGSMTDEEIAEAAGKKAKKDTLIPSTKEEEDEDEEKEKEEKSDEPEAKDEKIDFSDFEKRGLKLTFDINYDEWVPFLCKTDFKYCPSEDKIHHVYILTKEFEKEYSFILTSNKVRINTIFKDKEKINYKDKLNDIYVELAPLEDAFFEYFRLMKDLDNLNSDAAISDVEKFKKSEDLELKRKDASYKIKKQLINSLTGVENILSILINDYNEDNKLLEDPDEKVFFDKGLEGEKKVNNMNLIDAINQAYLFTIGFLYRLGEGDLGGFGLIIKEDEQNEIKESIQDELEPEDVSEEIPQEEESFLDEFNDIF